jgi:hypothetical protein
MSKTKAQILAAGCVKNAKEMLGSGWNHVSDDIRWGLVSSQILAIFLGQDETINPVKVRALIEEINAESRSLLDL